MYIDNDQCKNELKTLILLIQFQKGQETCTIIQLGIFQSGINVPLCVNVNKCIIQH